MGSDTMNTDDKQRFQDRDQMQGSTGVKKYLFTVQVGSSLRNTMATSVMGSLHDSAKFVAFIRKQHNMAQGEVKKEKDYSYMLSGDTHMVAWNDKIVIATDYSCTAKPTFSVDTSLAPAPPPSFNAANADDLKKEVNRYFTQKESESFASIKEFGTMFSEKADGYLFTSANSSLNAEQCLSSCFSSNC